MSRIFIFLSFMLVLSLGSRGQNVTISGKTDNGEKKRIQLITYADRISMLEKTLDECVIDETAKTFTLKTSINYPTSVYLKIENYSQEFFIEPNRNYEIIIPKFDWEKDESINPYFNSLTLPLVFNNLPQDDLNYLINKFDSVYFDNIKAYSRFLLLERKKRYIDSIRQNINQVMGEITHPYVLLYNQYKMAEVELACNVKSRKTLAQEFLLDKPILYNHIAYMDFFSNYFEKYYINGTKKIPFQRIDYWINENKLFPLLDSLGLDALLKNEVLRELVFLKGMNEALYIPSFMPGSIVKLLETFINETRFDEHKRIAKNIISQADKYYLPPPDPTFVLPNVEKHAVSITQFKGKWVYLGFVRVKDPASLIELETMAHYRDSLYAKYNIEFVTISCDREAMNLYHFLNSKRGARYNWIWLHFDNNFKLLEEYQVKVFPTFILINPEGHVYASPSKSPGEGVFVNARWLLDKKEETGERDGWE